MCHCVPAAHIFGSLLMFNNMTQCLCLSITFVGICFVNFRLLEASIDGERRLTVPIIY